MSLQPEGGAMEFIQICHVHLLRVEDLSNVSIMEQIGQRLCKTFPVVAKVKESLCFPGCTSVTAQGSYSVIRPPSLLHESNSAQLSRLQAVQTQLHYLICILGSSSVTLHLCYKIQGSVQAPTLFCSLWTVLVLYSVHIWGRYDEARTKHRPLCSQNHVLLTTRRDYGKMSQFATCHYGSSD